MAQFASDPFTGTEGATLSTYNPAWTQHSSSTVASEIASGRVRASGAGSSVYYHSGTPASADYSVSGDIYEASDEQYGSGVIARCDVSAATYYMARWYTVAATDVIQLYKFVAGTPTQLGTDINANFTTGTTRNIKLECIGSAIKVYIDGSGTSSISVTDSSITAAGKAGIRQGYGGSATPSDTQALHLTNFSADDIGGGGGGTPFGSVKVSGAWKTVSAIQVNVSGTWKSVSAAKVNVSGTWKTLA